MRGEGLTAGWPVSLPDLRRYDALALTALVWFLGKFLRYAFPPLFGKFEVIYGVSRTALGAAFSGLMLVYAAMQLPSGLIADRYGSVVVIMFGGVITGSGALMLVVDGPFPLLVVAMLLVGAGSGTYKTVAIELLSRIYPSETGRSLGVFDTVGSLAGVAAPASIVAATALPSVFGAPWRTLFLAGGLATIAVAAAFAVRVPRHLPDRSITPDGPDSTPAFREHLDLFSQPRFSAFVAVTILFSFTYNALVAFLPLYLTAAGELSSTTANLLFSILFAVSLVQLATGEASDRIGVLPILVVTLVAATVGLIGLVVLSGHVGAIALGASMVILGLGAHGYRPVRGAYLMEVLSGDVAKGTLGVVRTLLVGAGAVGPAVVGYLSDVTNFRVAFTVLTVAFGAATGVTVILWVTDR
ncbi:MFS transporter [Halorubrum tropicale]|uniref:MFS transporter n=1 Tax=Halorubrum tropicale TaxID=1765655 RepID=A0A0M9AMZ6_9EURY|nr:MFS transporter [Halorubrum tropicale]KOX95329.1 MFS transporter [Halorubrum tropicale]